jgi:hypothetical protein
MTQLVVIVVTMQAPMRWRAGGDLNASREQTAAHDRQSDKCLGGPMWVARLMYRHAGDAHICRYFAWKI